MANEMNEGTNEIGNHYHHYSCREHCQESERMNEWGQGKLTKKGKNSRMECNWKISCCVACVVVNDNQATN